MSNTLENSYDACCSRSSYNNDHFVWNLFIWQENWTSSKIITCMYRCSYIRREIKIESEAWNSEEKQEIGHNFKRPSCIYIERFRFSPLSTSINLWTLLIAQNRIQRGLYDSWIDKKIDDEIQKAYYTGKQNETWLESQIMPIESSQHDGWESFPLF